MLWGFIERHAPGASARNAPGLDELVHLALAYYRDFVKPAKQYRLPSAAERQGLEELAGWLEGFEAGGRTGDEIAAVIQEEVYEIGKRCGFADDLRAWFRSLYEILLGQTEGPRFGSFVAYYGPAETAALIRRRWRAAGSTSRPPELSAWHGLGAPRGVGRARPGAGPGAAVRRHFCRPSGAGCPEPARSRFRPPAAHHDAAPARPDRRAAGRASSRPRRARRASAICCAWARRSSVPGYAGPCGGRRDRGAVRARHAGDRASPTPCCATSRATARRMQGQDPSRSTRLDWLRESWREAYGEARARGDRGRAPGRAAARSHRPAGRGAVGQAARGDEDLRPFGAPRGRRTGRAAAGLRRGRLVDSGCGRGFAGPPAWRRRRRQVADLCAAPGGKTAQLCAKGANVTAVELSQKRAERLRANLARLHFAAEVVVADALEWRPPEPQDGRAAGCALYRHRHDPPPPRHRLAQDAGRRRQDGRAAGAAAGGGGRDGEARRPRGLCELLAAARGRAGGDRRHARGGPAGRAGCRSRWPSSTACRWT